MSLRPVSSASRWDRKRLREAANAVLTAGLKAADPALLVKRHLHLDDDSLSVAGVRHRFREGRRLVVVSAGKAAGPMAQAAEEVLGERIDHALAVDTSARGTLQRTQVRLARHPVPDRRGLEAAAALESLAQGLDKDDLLLVLVSGGASALLPAPVPGITLEDKAVVTSLLTRAGATIGDTNTVRKHLSRLKGGGLARAASPARVVCLVLSDVVGDDLSTIASGPTVPDPTTYADAIEVLERFGLAATAPAAVRRHLAAG
ncbi:MAG TPA: glycerate-2-kinase family protein, partial [Vicinamibacteria bacterium]